ncbi:MAG: hypothetical protein CVU08_09875 [Bacteroidetes bacterium HGW-Bacteroidetes-3]|jgi:hypothetical protein|nr:MAG: hypothetical protein CVU08_09875 [Bacteroidetes bacterium HGW-Bacteroidetes-3]
MKSIYPFLLIILLLNFSCNRNKETALVSEKADSLKIDVNRIENKIGETLIPEAKTAMDNWKEYRDVDELILKYYSITNLEALSNAQELAELVMRLKDSLRVEKLQKANIIARINVLHNETLRLADMANIPSISKAEVKDEVSNIVSIYSAINSKINTIYQAETLQNALEVDTETPIELKENVPAPVYRNMDRNRTFEKVKKN